LNTFVAFSRQASGQSSKTQEPQQIAAQATAGLQLV